MSKAPRTGPVAEGAIPPVPAEWSDMLSHSQRMCQAAATALGHEGQQFFSGMIRDAAMALGQFGACKSPLDVLAVENNWLLTRAKAYADCGLRLFEAAANCAAPTGDAPPHTFVLPE